MRHPSSDTVEHVESGTPVTYPSHEEIAARAFELYERRGSTDQHDVDDWLEAERELLLERSASGGERDPQA